MYNDSEQIIEEKIVGLSKRARKSTRTIINRLNSSIGSCLLAARVLEQIRCWKKVCKDELIENRERPKVTFAMVKEFITVFFNRNFFTTQFQAVNFEILRRIVSMKEGSSSLIDRIQYSPINIWPNSDGRSFRMLFLWEKQKS